MRPIPESLYRQMAALLAERLGAESYFNGTLCVETPEATHRLTATLLVYRSAGRVVDVVPVWWEFVCIEEAGEVETDFEFSSLRGYLIEN